MDISNKIIQRILNILKIEEKDIICLFPYGSRVYGNYKSDSDFDFIVVSDAPSIKDNQEYRNGDINIHTWRKETYQKLLDEHKITALECYFLPDNLKIIEHFVPKFKLDKTKLRHEISAKTSNSYVKAKKKLTVENETYIGQKSLFHALRIVDFGNQICLYGKIKDFSSSNDIFKEILKMSPEWTGLNQRWKPIYNSMMSEFRQMAPK